LPNTTTCGFDTANAGVARIIALANKAQASFIPQS
jgi:hypothetical protein